MSPGTENTDLLQPVSSRPLKHENKPTTTQAAPSKPQTFTDAKQAREESKPFKVAGGIFRHTGNHTIISRTPSETASVRQSSTESRATPSNTSAPRLSKSPTTLLQFTKSWESLQSDSDKWNLICVSYYCGDASKKLNLYHSDNPLIFDPTIVPSLVGTRVAQIHFAHVPDRA